MSRCASIACAAVLLTVFTSARVDAALLSLGLQQAGINGGAITTVATDASSPGNLSFLGAYGTFSLGDTGASGSAGQSPFLNSSALVESNSTGGILFIYVTQQGLTSPQGVHPLLSIFAVNSLSGTVGPVTMSTLVSASNQLYDGSVLAPKTTFTGSGSASSTHDTPDLSGPYSQTAVYEIVANGEGTANIGIEISGPLGSTPPAVTQPGSLTLLVMGLAGLALARRGKAGPSPVDHLYRSAP